MPSSVPQERSVPSLLRQARRQLMSSGNLPPDLIRPELSKSWMRCWIADLQPCGRVSGAPRASGAQLPRELEVQHELVAHARPVMEFLLDQTCETDSMFFWQGLMACCSTPSATRKMMLLQGSRV